MKQLKALLHPGRKTLIVTGSLSVPFFFFYSYLSAFSPFFPSVFSFLFPALGLLGFVSVALILDGIFKTRSIKYSIVILSVLPACFFAFYVLMPLIKKNTEQRGEQLATAIEQYKTTNGHYPEDLSGAAFKEVPKSALFLRSFNYHLYLDEKKDSTFYLHCSSFRGMDAYYYPSLHTWVYRD